MRTERFAGLYSATLNPAQTAFMPHPWEINLVAAEGFFENNYGYLTNSGVFRVMHHLGDLTTMLDTAKASLPLQEGSMQLGFYNDPYKFRGVFQGRMTGPSFAFRIGKEHVVGLVTAVRAEASGYQMPQFLRARRLEDRKRFIEEEITDINGGLLSWGEIGLHYSYLYQGDAVTLAFGATPKLLFGLEAGFARSNGSLQFCSTKLDSMAFSRGDWEIAMTTGNLHALETMGNSGSMDIRSLSPELNGMGGGLDLGFVIAMPKYEDADQNEYNWRLGVSLIDFGLIRFRNRSEYHHFTFDSTHVISSLSYSKDRNPDHIMERGNLNFYGQPDQSLKRAAFTTFLPSALAIEFDYRLSPELSVGSVLVQRITFGKFAIRHVNTFSIVPRFERRWLAVSAPVSLSDWQSWRAGFSLRLGSFILGTDNLNSYWRQKKFTGSDVYAGLKINGWNLFQGDGLSRRSMRKIKCPFL